MELYIIITLLVILLIILFYNIYNESFTDLPKPVTQNSDVRVDFTCASSDQKNIFDRFDYAQKATSNGVCLSNYTRITNYFGSSNLCLPNCPSGYRISSNDNTLCIADVCFNTPDLSDNILGSWLNTCSVIYKNQYNLETTLTNISNVTDSFRKQTGTINTEYNDLNTSLQNICSLPGNEQKCIIKDRHMGNIGSRYNTIMNLTSNINYNYNYLSNRKNSYDNLYYDLLCDRYL